MAVVLCPRPRRAALPLSVCASTPLCRYLIVALIALHCFCGWEHVAASTATEATPGTSWSGDGADPSSVASRAATFFAKGHTNNWAVLVCTSRFWFNYRHVANVLSIYRSVKRLGIPDSRIILMLADDMACNSRNPSPATIFNDRQQHMNVYGDDVEVDYRNYDVTVESFIRLLTGRVPENTPTAKRLLTDEHSNILVYMTGHGGEGFLKFQDSKELTNVELADAFEQMWQMRRYNEILYIVDSCHSESMFLLFYSPNILAVSSSRIDEDSLSHHGDPRIGVYVIDRYTYYVLQFLERVKPDSTATIDHFFKVCPKSQCLSTVATRSNLFRRNIKETPLVDFFGGVRNIELTRDLIDLPQVSLSS